MEQAQYHESVRTAFYKQQQEIDSLLQLVNDMSGRLRGLEDRAERRKFYSVFSTVFLLCLSCCLLLV